MIANFAVGCLIGGAALALALISARIVRYVVALCRVVSSIEARPARHANDTTTRAKIDAGTGPKNDAAATRVGEAE
jgi:hypothetical protein